METESALHLKGDKITQHMKCSGTKTHWPTPTTCSTKVTLKKKKKTKQLQIFLPNPLKDVNNQTFWAQFSTFSSACQKSGSTLTKTLKIGVFS